MQVYPLALAVVEKENANHWSWFLQWLRHSLELGTGETVTVISDMQKISNLLLLSSILLVLMHFLDSLSFELTLS
ncbi:hypothetical protein K1719_013063 [Acacia pycnantha]|nr:hypothetical protein K1719_013063 [Acacia pycnantha]